jgi:chemosensory pili system protein ChpA (sensor histidine kinase/response regulator)
MEDALTIAAVRHKSRPYVLVVEDDSACKRMLLSQLRRDGFEVDGVDDGSTAISALAERRPDLVCIDLGLPLVSGFELCEWVRHNPSLAEVPLLVITSRTSLEDVAHATEAGADEVLSKPYRHAQLLAAARRLLDSSSRGRTAGLPVVH